MITSRVRMIFFGNEIWDKPPLTELIHDMFVSERRIGKESNLEIERSRYSLICQFIEDTALDLESTGLAISVYELEMDYPETLRYIKAEAEKNKSLNSHVKSGRLLATVFPPATLKDHLMAWEAVGFMQGKFMSVSVEKRLNLIRQMVDKKAGLIDFVSPYHDSLMIEDLLDGTSSITDGSLVPSSTPIDANYGDTDILSQVDWLRREINQALTDHTYVNFTNPNHIAITKVLHEFVYMPRPYPGSIRVVYGDGSEAEPFRFDGLGEPSPNNNEERQRANQMHVSLVSMRHPAQDLAVCSAWFLNQRVSTSMAFAETEYLCCEKTLQILEQLKKPVIIHLYQTGLQPAVVGFYRGFLKYRCKNSYHPDVWIQPWFYRSSGGHQPGKIWW